MAYPPDTRRATRDRSTYTEADRSRVLALRADGLSWTAVSRAVGIPAETCRRWSMGADPFTVAFNATGRHRVGVDRRCEDCARPMHRSTRGDVCRTCIGARRRRATAEAAVRALAAYVQEHGRPPAADEWQAEHRQPSPTAMQNVFGSWRAALAAAGLDPLQRMREYNEARCRAS